MDVIGRERRGPSGRSPHHGRRMVDANHEAADLSSNGKDYAEIRAASASIGSLATHLGSGDGAVLKAEPRSHHG